MKINEIQPGMTVAYTKGKGISKIENIFYVDGKYYLVKFYGIAHPESLDSDEELEVFVDD